MKFNKDTLKGGNSPGFIIHRLDLLLKLGLQRAFREQGFDFTAEQWGVLLSLYEGESINQSELVARSGKDKHNITRILNVMEKRGYVRRVPHTQDKRRFNIILTKKSRDIEGKLTSIVLNFLDKAFAGLSQNDVLAMRKMHDRIIANVKSLLG